MAVRPGLFFSKSPTRTSRNQTARTHRRDAEGAEDAEISRSSKCNTRRLFTLRALRLGGEFLDRFGEGLICKRLMNIVGLRRWLLASALMLFTTGLILLLGCS